jgi:NAD(P)-dependent dehydrogenase (short-subunit alcohol dehydrogenase family)
MQERPIVALVTGAGSGIGAATTHRFAAEGAAVAAADIDGEAVARIADELRGTARACHPITVDLRDREGADAAVRSTVENLGGIDVLVTAAGISRRNSVADTTDAEWDEVVDLNLGAVFRCCRAAIPEMRKRGGGAIVTVGSAWGVVAGPRAAAYAASKGAVINLTRAMAIDHGPEGIRVNSVCPGDIDTPLLRSEMEQVGLDPSEALKESALSRPVQRVGTADDVAAAIAYLASSDSGYITGTTLVIDGGWLAGG